MSGLAPTPERCRLCGAALTDPPLIEGTVFGGTPEQRFWECTECHVAFLSPPLTEEEEAHFYASEFERFMERRLGDARDFDWSGPEEHSRSNHKQYVRRRPYFDRLVRSGDRALEIGCSSGFMLQPLRDEGMEVVGVEPSQGFTGWLRSKGLQVFHSEDEMAESGAVREGFDLVMHFFVLEHVADPLGFLRRGLELLKPDGTMVFEVPSRDDPLVTIYDVPAFRDFYWSVAHNWYFDARSLRWLLDELGAPYEIAPEQRYDLSNHMTWALDGKPGGQGRFSASFAPGLDLAYLESMKSTGHCDTLIGTVRKEA